MLFRVPDLPDKPLDAAARFHADAVPEIRAQIAARADPVLVLFAPTDHTHEAWRRAAIEELAREAVPSRVNALISHDDAAIAAAERYLESAAGLTGQILTLDGKGAGKVL